MIARMRVGRRVREWLRAAFAPGWRFDSPPAPIDQLILSLVGGTYGAVPKVSRSEALAVPGILRGRNMICSISTLPLVQYNGKNDRVPSSLLDQVDPDVANVVTFAMTLEDLLFEGISWWRITRKDPFGFPLNARHLDVATVSVDPPDGALPPIGLPSGIDPRGLGVWINGEFTLATEVIRFDSPNPPVLRHAGRSIRSATLYALAAQMYAEDPRPLDYFTPAEGADEPTDDQVKAILNQWKAERKKRGTAYVPGSLEYHDVEAPSPQQLQLVELQKQASLDMANALSIDPEDLGISTTSRTYANAVDRRRDKINDVLSSFMLAITQRLTMGDVTRRGHRVAYDLDDYMRANPTERWNVYKAAFEMVDGEGRRAMTIDEIRAEESMPPAKPDPSAIPAAPAAPSDGAPTPAGEPQTAPADGPGKNVKVPTLTLSATFDRATIGTGFTCDLPVSMAFKVDRERRIIEGVALPYGQVIRKMGLEFRFLRNSIVWNERAPGRVKLLEDHDTSAAIGFAKGLRNVGDELRTRWKIGRGPAGDAALMSAEDGIKDGLSVGVDFDFETDVFVDDDGVLNIRHAVLREVSLTAVPAFDDARVTSVAASRDNGGTMNPCATCGHQHAPDAACVSTPPTNNPPTGTPAVAPASANQATAALALNADQLAALATVPGVFQALATPAAPATPAAEPGALTLSREQVAALVATGGIRTLFGLPAGEPVRGAPVEPGPSPVNPTAHPTPGNRPTAVTAAREPIPYRFDREGNLTAGVQYDFSRDLIAGSRGDGDALDRATKFVQAMKHQFTYGPDARSLALDVDTTDVAGLNPNRNRPDMYVDQKDFTYPVWDAISKGTLADQTPFVLPKFATATGLVADHVQGTGPTPGTFTATSQTITPSALSGRVEITREAWDQGGNPQLSGIIWRQMVKAWFEGLEAAAVAMLDALTPTGITITTAATNDDLVRELESALASLQFIRGGFRMRDFFIQVDLYKALVDASDADGRKLLPRIGPVNANGQVSDFFADLDIGGLRGRPAWALAASGTVAASSYLFDRNDVHGWATAPQRLQFEYRVEYVDVAIWGYKALANTDLTGVREVIYDPA